MSLELLFQRDLLGFVLAVCLPTMIAFLMGYLTNYFEENHFDAAIGVNLTILLVLTTI